MNCPKRDKLGTLGGESGGNRPNGKGEEPLERAKLATVRNGQIGNRPKGPDGNCLKETSREVSKTDKLGTV